MVALRCYLSEETQKTKTIPEVMDDICEHLAGEPAYEDSAILVGSSSEPEFFYICLGGEYNKDELVFDVTI